MKTKLLILALVSAFVLLSCGNTDSSAETVPTTTTSTDAGTTTTTVTAAGTTAPEEDPSSVEESSAPDVSEGGTTEKVTTTTVSETSSTPDETAAAATTTASSKATAKPTTKATAKATTKTTTKTTTHTHRWVKQWDDGNGTIFYWCPDCFAEKYDHYTVTTTTTKTQPASKTIQSNEWIPVYNKTFVTHTIGTGYEKIVDAKGNVTCGKKIEFVSKTYWDPNAVRRGDATEIAKRTKAQDEAESFISRKDLTCCTWVSSGNDHYIDVPDKHNIVFYYYKDSNGKYAIWVNNSLNGVVTKESDLSSYGCYDYSILGTNNLTSKYVYFTGTPWEGKF